MTGLKLLTTIAAVMTSLTFHQKCFGTESGEAQGSSSGYFKTLSSTTAQSQRIICESGEEVIVSVTELPRNAIVRAQKDGPIIYMEDTRARLYSFEVDSSTGVVSRTKIFRFPVLGTIYNLFKTNYFTLSKDNDGQVMPWTISYVVYDNNPKSRTISLFETVKAKPGVIRNRDPWLLPGLQYDHCGPLNFTSVDLTASGRYVAVSGFHQGKKAFAFRPLNYDSAGHNFMFHYQLAGQSTVTWSPKFLIKYLSRYLRISQEPFPLPQEDWNIVRLDDSHQPNILLIENGRRLVVPCLTRSGIHYDVYNIIGKRWERMEEHRDIDFSKFRFHQREWPVVSPLLPLSLEPSCYCKAILNGRRGIVRISSQEPLFGTFIGETTPYLEQPIYKVRRSLFDSVFNRLRYYDGQGNKVDFKLEPV
jgi:hypothetical protein